MEIDPEPQVYEDIPNVKKTVRTLKVFKADARYQGLYACIMEDVFGNIRIDKKNVKINGLSNRITGISCKIIVFCIFCT